MIAATTDDAQVVSLLRTQLATIFSGTFFVLVGLIAFSVAAVRRRGGVSILVWFGIWSGIFGANELARSAAIVNALPSSVSNMLPTIQVALAYLMVVAGTVSFFGLSRGRLRTLLQLFIAAGLLIAVVGMSSYFITGAADTLTLYNNLLAVLTLVTLVAAVAIPQLSKKYLVVAGHRVLTVGVLIFAAQALLANLARPFSFRSPDLSSAGFAVLLIAFGYTALQMIDINERRLVAINNELEIARQLQFSILPEAPPEIANLRISAAYEPMTAVAGDFYEFLPADKNSIGFLVADVSGHGVPAALIASMIKVAVQSVNGCASSPSEVLRRLSEILSGHLRGQFVSAAYLWLDTQSRIARYSAAGHPPLLHWHAEDKTLSPIESNGLILGVMPNSHCPECELSFKNGDRFLLYTDGVIECENTAGEQFGERRLGEVIRSNSSASAEELSARLLTEVRAWQPSSAAQQDDITIVVIDAV